MNETRSLWDVEDVDAIPKVRNMTVSRVGNFEVAEFCRRYHYTGIGASTMWRWGLWTGPTLWGVVAYNMASRDACAAVFGDQHAQHVWHMGRLAMADHSPPNSESRLIGGSLRHINREHPDVWAVLTYAAPSAGHIGYVYQATNAIYTGTGGRPFYYIDTEGRRRSTRQGVYLQLADAAARGWTVHAESPKHRYLYILGNRRQRAQRRAMLLLPTLPYPKPATLNNDGQPGQ